MILRPIFRYCIQFRSYYQNLWITDGHFIGARGARRAVGREVASPMGGCEWRVVDQKSGDVILHIARIPLGSSGRCFVAEHESVENRLDPPSATIAASKQERAW